MPAAEQPRGKRELLVSKTWLQVAGLVIIVPAPLPGQPARSASSTR